MKMKLLFCAIASTQRMMLMGSYQPYPCNQMIITSQLLGIYEMGFKANRDTPGFHIRIFPEKDFIGFGYDQTKAPERGKTIDFDTKHIAFLIEPEGQKILVDFPAVIKYLQDKACKKSIPSWLELRCKKVLASYFRNTQNLDGLCYMPMFGEVEEGRHTDRTPMLILKPKKGRS